MKLRMRIHEIPIFQIKNQECLTKIQQQKTLLKGKYQWRSPIWSHNFQRIHFQDKPKSHLP